MLPQLPQEVMCIILSHLSFKDLYHVSLTCKSLYSLSQENSFWVPILAEKYAILSAPTATWSQSVPPGFVKNCFRHIQETQSRQHVLQSNVHALDTTVSSLLETLSDAVEARSRLESDIQTIQFKLKELSSRKLEEELSAYDSALNSCSHQLQYVQRVMRVSQCNLRRETKARELAEIDVYLLQDKIKDQRAQIHQLTRTVNQLEESCHQTAERQKRAQTKYELLHHRWSSSVLKSDNLQELVNDYRRQLLVVKASSKKKAAEYESSFYTHQTMFEEQIAIKDKEICRLRARITKLTESDIQLNDAMKSKMQELVSANRMMHKRIVLLEDENESLRKALGSLHPVLGRVSQRNRNRFDH